jgi:hypothetical protein
MALKNVDLQVSDSNIIVRINMEYPINKGHLSFDRIGEIYLLLF